MVLAGVHGPHRAMRAAVLAPPRSRPYLAIAARPYAEHVGMKRQVTTLETRGEIVPR